MIFLKFPYWNCLSHLYNLEAGVRQFESWWINAAELKAALAGLGVDNSVPDIELVGLPSAEASESSAPLTQKNNIVKIPLVFEHLLAESVLERSKHSTIQTCYNKSRVNFNCM